MPDELILKFSVDDKGSVTMERINEKIKGTGTAAKGIVPGLESARGSLTSFVGQNAALIGVLVGVGLAFKNALDTTIKYAGEVRDLSLATGGTAEASSRLLQVLDDYQITAGDVTAGMRAMKEKGIVPTVEALAMMSDQFLAIQDPAEKLKFAQDNLGRSSAKFLNVLSQGGDKIRELNDGISESLILTDADIQKTEEARLSLDAWGDAVTGVKVEMAMGMLPALTDILNVTNDWARAEELAAEQGKDLWMVGLGEAQAFIELAKEERHATAAVQEHGEAVDGTTLSIEEQTKALKEQSEANTNLMSLIGTLQSETDSYRESAAGLHEQQDALRQDYVDGTIGAEEYGAQMDELTEQVKANQEAHAQAGREIMFNLVSQEMAIGGLLTTERIALQKMGVAWGIFDQQTVNAANTMMEAGGTIDEQLGAINDAFKEPIGKMTQANEKLHALQNMAGEMWTYYVNIETSGSFPNFPGAGGGVVTQNSVANQLQENYATGGSFVIPSQYGYEGFGMGGMATASAGELVTITPKGGNPKPQGTTININGPVYVTANNAEDFMMSIQGEL